MSTHAQIGDIAIAVGSYPSGDTTKKRYRKIGVLMESTDDDGGGKRLWMRLNADIFHASLFALASSVGRAKGEDSITAQVFVEREKKAAAEGVAGQEPEPF